MAFFADNRIVNGSGPLSASTENNPDHGEIREGVLVAEPQTRLKRPSFYRVVLLNDDYTPMDFVVKVLESIFRKEHSDAVRIMLDVHKKGAGLCGVYTRDVAETKIDQTLYLARQHEHPLQCVMELE
jgi:ATP-dependent Clp protease adaptor protein ClpS